MAAVAANEFKVAAKEFLTYVNASPSPFHAVHEAAARLVAAGFTELKERDHWDIRAAHKYFFTRNQSTLIAFATGAHYKPGNGFSIVGAHTDSPCLRVKPGSVITKHGFVGVAVECYGGGLFHTWFDRDLGLAGRVIVKTATGQLTNRLVNITRPILRIPTLCIHLDRSVADGFVFNKENHLVPLLATSCQLALEAPIADSPAGSQAAKHHPLLIKLLSAELDCQPDAIVDFELCLADTQPGVLGGALEEFIFAPRLDNLMNAFCGIEALIRATAAPDALANEHNVRVVSLYDHEEVGSASAQGAESSLTEYLLRRLSVSAENQSAYEEAVPKSMLISADMAHAVHPNYPEKHEERHRPQLHGGPVLKFNSNQRYATNAVTASILRQVAALAGVPLQDMVVRNDSACGSTIGPILSSGLAIRTVDIGNPQLSMHSIREQCCTSGTLQAIKLFQQFFESFPAIERDLVLD